MAKWQFKFWRRRVRSARYYQVFGQEPDYPCAFICVQFVFGTLKCLIFYILIYLLLKWYIWPMIESRLTRYSFVQMTLNRSSSIFDRFRDMRE